VNQIKLTNVAVVRLKKGGKRFEIATYPNKVTEWRLGDEKDLDEVLQSPRVFLNVSKGIVAKKEDLTVFGNLSEQKVFLEILNKGELQVGAKERQHQQDQMFRDIATIVAEKCINPLTQKPITVSLVEKSMKEIHYSVKPGKSAKIQALKVIQLLQKDGTTPIERAQMRLKVEAPKGAGRKLKETLDPLINTCESENYGTNYQLTFTIDPGKYREVDEIVTKTTKSKGSVEVLDVCVVNEAVTNEEQEVDEIVTKTTKSKGSDEVLDVCVVNEAVTNKEQEEEIIVNQ